MERKLIRIPLYQVQLLVYYGNYDELAKINRQYGFSKLHESIQGRTMWDEDTNRFALLFRNEQKITIGCIVHECKHMVNLIFLARGVTLDINNDEPECYLLEWLVNKVCSILKIK